MAAPTPRKASRTRETLLEAVSCADAPLKVDEAAGIIYGVKVLGRYSPNNYGLREAENGTEYPPDTMRQALNLYEGIKVRVNHPADRRDPNKERAVEDTFGVLRNCRVDGDCIRADLHYNRKHDMAPKVVEDVQRGLGLYGLSHNAGQAKERFDRASKRLIIESIGVVRSVDLVDKPATNRNLWESNVSTQTKKYTLKGLLESQRTRFSQARLSWLDRLLEDDGMKPMLAEEGEMPAETAADPNEAMRSAFEASIASIISSALAGECDPKDALKKIGEMLKTHAKLTAKEEPADAKTESEEDDVAKKDEKPADKQESIEQKFAKLERKDACRDLCESLGFTPTKDQLGVLMEITSEPARKIAAEAFKPAPGKAPEQTRKPRSTAPGGKNLLESKNDQKIPEGVAGEMSFLRRG